MRLSSVTSRDQPTKILRGTLQSSKFVDIRYLYYIAKVWNQTERHNSTPISASLGTVLHFFLNPSMDLLVKAMFFASRCFEQLQLLTQSKIKVRGLV